MCGSCAPASGSAAMKSFVRAALLAAAVSVLTVLPVPTASAAAPFPRMDAATVDGYHLTPGSTFTVYGDRIAALEKRAQLKPSGFCWEDANDDFAVVAGHGHGITWIG